MVWCVCVGGGGGGMRAGAGGMRTGAEWPSFALIDTGLQTPFFTKSQDTYNTIVFHHLSPPIYVLFSSFPTLKEIIITYHLNHTE